MLWLYFLAESESHGFAAQDLPIVSHYGMESRPRFDLGRGKESVIYTCSLLATSLLYGQNIIYVCSLPAIL